MTALLVGLPVGLLVGPPLGLLDGLPVGLLVGPSVRPAAVVAVVAAGTSAVLLLGGLPSLRTASTGSAARRARRAASGPAAVLAAAAGVGLLVPVLDGLRLALVLVVVATGAAAGALVRRSRRARESERRRAQVVEVAEALVGELRAGQPLVAALEHCAETWAETWAELEVVVASARLGADVPTSLRRLARAPGAEGLLEVASAWQVSQASGAGLASSLAQVAETARARQATRDVVRGELASAQATARLVALLPFASLAMSSGIGGHPWHFLLATPGGLACLATGVLLAFAGLLWIDRIATGVLRG